jgi:bacterioferritin
MAKTQVIEALNQALAEEITALNQYFMHAELCEHWGFEGLSKFVKKQSIDEMKHAEKLVERILKLGGIPRLDASIKLKIGKDVAEMLANDYALEEGAVRDYNKWIEVARQAEDNGTRIFLEAILKDEESHLDWLGTQRDLIASIGIQNYLARQIDTSAE